MKYTVCFFKNKRRYTKNNIQTNDRLFSILAVSDLNTLNKTLTNLYSFIQKRNKWLLPLFNMPLCEKICTHTSIKQIYTKLTLGTKKSKFGDNIFYV